MLRLFRFVENLGISEHRYTDWSHKNNYIGVETESQINLDTTQVIRSYGRIFSEKSCTLREGKRGIITSNMEVPVNKTFLVSFNVAFVFDNEALLLFKAINSCSSRFCKEK